MAKPQRRSTSRGWHVSRQGKPQEAVELFQKAYGLDATLAGVAAQIGGALFELGKPDEAAPWFEKELAISPDAKPVALNLAVVLTAVGEPKREQAIAAWERVIQIDPYETGSYVELANIYTEMGDEDKAAEYLRKMEEVGQPNAAAWFNIGANFANKDALDKAELAYKKALEIDPTLALAHREMGYLFARKGDLTTALDHFKTYVASRRRQRTREA
ncbi:MAG: tetratricopeptide repeat protein [Acidobacteria bacterium]|nr:tetratricopeptide repeat protein [Acidobacteriota bacterium]